MTLDDVPSDARRPIEGDPDKDKRWVIGSLIALVAIFGFFVALSRYDGATHTADTTPSPQASGPSAGSSSLPKGPATTGDGATSAPASR